ncbi:arylesterase [Algiphilus sp.]|uniref:arylesterase n=1 Tax=Algiphilus sp. TaxID=1872431 RepID=UPI003B51F763
MQSIARFSISALAPAFLLVLLSACGGARDSYDGPPLSRLAPDAVVLAFGDSLTYGTGAAREASYPARLADRIDRRVVNAGVPGETSGEGRQRLPQWLQRSQPDLVLLCLGGNDMLRRQSTEATRDNLAAMIAMIRNHGAEVVLIAVPKLQAWSLEPHPIYASLGETLQVPVLEAALAEILSEGKLKSDAIHPNARGYTQLATALHDLLTSAGALP